VALWNPWASGNSQGWNFSGGGGTNFAGASPQQAQQAITAGTANLAGVSNNLQSQVGSAYGASQAAGYSPAAGVQSGQQIQSSVSGNPGYANQALATGFNNNNELYKRQLSNVTDQTNAALSERGLGMSPYGAQILGDQFSQFNANWEQNQLQNQATAAQTAATLQGQYASSMTGGQAVQQAAAMQPLMALSSMVQSGVQATQPLQAGISDMLSYLSQVGKGKGAAGGGGDGAGSDSYTDSMGNKVTGTLARDFWNKRQDMWFPTGTAVPSAWRTAGSSEYRKLWGE
jgi:hypothetical protein